jgi:hypothetical protein
MSDTLTRDEHCAQTVCDELGVVREIDRDLLGHSEAVFSDDYRYRYLLTRRWAVGGTTATFLMLNPSTATASADDPTIRRCVGYARRWGHSALNVVNLYGWRATDPRELRRVDDPVGPLNDRFIRQVCQAGRLNVAAWGIHGSRGDRAAQVVAMLDGLDVDLTCLEVTSRGQPRHPLFCRLGLEPKPYLL